jgi:hypothetical protein
MADGDVVPMLTEQRVREIVRDELWAVAGDAASAVGEVFSEMLSALLDGALGSVAEVITGRLLLGDGRKHA